MNKLWIKIVAFIFIISFVVAFNYGGCGGSSDENTSGSSSSVTVSIVTNPATNVTQTTATLNGTVNPNGVATNVYFEYGRTTAYNLYTSYQYIGDGTTDITLSANVTGLSINTTYNFRIKAVRGGSTYDGSNLTFTTPGLMPVCVTGFATNVSYGSAQLNGTVNANTLATTAYFNYGLTTSYGSTTLSSPIGSAVSNFPVTTTISGLLENTLYNFRVVGTNSAGTTYGNNRTFTTTVSPKPICVTKLATNITANSARLNGTVNPNALPTNAYFGYGLNGSYTITTTLQAIGSGTANIGVTADISGLSLNTEYSFRIAGTSSAGTNYGNNRTFTTGNSSGSAPTCMTDDVDNISFSSAILYGTVIPNGVATTAWFGLGISATPPTYTITTNTQSISSSTTSVAITATADSLTPDTSYNFRVVGTNSGGTTNGNNLTFTTLLPISPTCVTNAATNVTYNSATLNATVNPKGSNTTTYFQWGLSVSYGTNTIFQNSGSGTSAVTVSQSITGLSANTVYYFKVSATNSVGTTYGANRMFGTWLQTTFTTGTFSNTETTIGTADVILRTDPVSPPGSSWSTTIAATPANGTTGGALCYPGSGDYIYAFQGGTTTFWRYSISGNSWTTPGAAAVAPAATAAGSALCYPGSGDYIYAFRGGVTTFWRYSITGNSWIETLAATPATVGAGGALVYPGSGYYIYALGGNSTTNFWSYQCWNYPSSGSYISAAITPTNVSYWGVLTYTYTAPANTIFTVDVLSSSNNAVLLTNVSSGINLSQTYAIFSGITGIKLRANFSTTVNTATPTLLDWGVAWTDDNPTFPLPPIVVATPATTSWTSAVLNAIVNPNGANTIAWFEYGITNTPITYPLSITAVTAIGSGTGNVAVSATTGSLISGTIYNYRCVATNSAGTTNGGNQTFPTISCTTNAATNVTSNSATLNGTVNPNGYNVTSCYFQYGTTISYGSTVTASVFAATGGTITYSGGYAIHTFTSSGTFTPNGARNVEVLVVAGGGSGGNYTTTNGNGGGGGGGVIYNTSFAVTTGTAYTVTVGAGGAAIANVTSARGNNGANSVFGSLTAIGGGGGGSTGVGGGLSGGSGGGGAYSGYAGGTSTQTGGYGNAGGAGLSGGSYYAGGGGGGAGSAGNAGLNTNAAPSGNGGTGFGCSISGSLQYYAGGGGGGANSTERAGDGFDGGGRGCGATSYYTAYVYTAEVNANTRGYGTPNAIANTGGGGGGGSYWAPNGGWSSGSGAGGSGIVIARYLPTLPGSGSSPISVTANASSLAASTQYNFRLVVANVGGTTYANNQTFTTPVAFAATGGTITYINNYTIHTFASSGTFTPNRAGNVEVLVVAGGGSGGMYASSTNANGGGGGGGVIYNTSFAVTTGTAYTVTVGAGGAAIANGTTARGNNGANSVFSTLTAIGGGGGGATGVGGGLNGGCGGGAAYNGYTGGASTQTGGYGNAGGASAASYTGGGGGGAGSAGVAGSGSAPGGNGGTGFACSISGSLQYYAGGGGGGGNTSQQAGDGYDGGGRGVGTTTYYGYTTYTVEINANTRGSGTPNAIANTGGGGGAGSSYGSGQGWNFGSGAGGSGIVIIRYPTNSSIYRVHTFASNGTFSVTSGTGNIEVLVVAGGGSGGNYSTTNANGGGGGGGVISNSAYAVAAGSYTVTVGAGGAAVPNATSAQGNNGTNSVFGSLTAIGGGGGGSTGAGVNGKNGGCGGGAAASGGSGGSSTQTGGYGNAGGASAVSWTGAGGGGAGSVGVAGSGSAPGGNGGTGFACSISGSLQYYAGGGGGCGNSSNRAGDGFDGGGRGCGTTSYYDYLVYTIGVNATTRGSGTPDAIPNTGGGGGGGSYWATITNTGWWDGRSGAGGSGIVIVRYPISSGIVATGGAVTDTGAP